MKEIQTPEHKKKPNIFVKIAFWLLIVAILVNGIADICSIRKSETRQYNEKNEAKYKDSVEHYNDSLNIDKILRKEYNVRNVTYKSNEYELTKAELLSAFDSIQKYSANSKCYTIYTTSGTNGGKAQSKLRQLLKEKGYEFRGGGPWNYDTKTPISYFKDDDCVGIVIDRF